MRFPKSSFVFQALSLSGVGALSSWQDRFYHEEIDATHKMWVFASSGIHVMEPDGSSEIVHHHNEDICQSGENARGPPGEIVKTCQFVEGFNDGVNYVWITNSAPDSRYYVDVYSIWTGRLVASLPSCTVPRHIDYAPHRQELWVHCWLFPGIPQSEDDKGQIYVFSTNLLGWNDHVKLHNTTIHTHGNVVVDSSIPNIAFGMSERFPTLYKIDANTKEVLKEIPVDKTQGVDEHAFSPVNRHLYLRTYPCCSCGLDKDTGMECGARGVADIIVKNGPFASPNPQQGYCGLFCRGTPADTEGLWEYDTIQDQFLGQHFPATGNGAKPFSTPLGDYVLIGAGDGGDEVSVLRPGATGEKSSVVGTIKLNFDTGAGIHGMSDVVFVEDASRNLAIFTSTLSNLVKIVNMNDFASATASSPRNAVSPVVEVKLPDDAEATHDARGIWPRRVRWATGTNFVWVDSRESKHVHIIDLGDDKTGKDASVLRTLQLESLEFIYVNSLEQDAVRNDIKMIATETAVDQDDVDKATTLSIVAIVMSGIAMMMGLVMVVANAIRGGGKSGIDHSFQAATKHGRDGNGQDSKDVSFNSYQESSETSGQPPVANENYA